MDEAKELQNAAQRPKMQTKRSSQTLTESSGFNQYSLPKVQKIYILLAEARYSYLDTMDW